MRCPQLAATFLEATPAAPRLPMPKLVDPPEPPRARRPGAALGMIAFAGSAIAGGGIPTAGWSPGRVARYPSRVR